MSFTSPSFVFFVAFSLFLSSILGPRARKILLLTIGFVWYASWRIEWLVGLILVSSLNYVVLSRARESSHGEKLGRALIAFDAFLLLALKSAPLVSTFQTPFGVSFYLFTLIAAVFDLTRNRKIDGPGSVLDFMLFSSFFPVMVAGPIERWAHLAPQLKNPPKPTHASVVDGIVVFAIGFFKAVGLARPLEAEMVHRFSQTGTSIVGLLLTGAIGMLWAYASFSGICDMGRGVAKGFGVDVSVNFRPFYYAKNPNEFWQRWNLTLGTWIRDYVTLPAMLTWGRKVNRYVFVIAAFAIVGIWHGLTVNWIAFGLFNGVVLVLFAWLQNGPFLKRPRATRLVGYVTLAILAIGNGLLQNRDVFVFLASANLAGTAIHAPLDAGELVRALFALLLVDFLQERSKSSDFVTGLPWTARRIGAAFAILLFLFLLNEGNLIEPDREPPLYFRF